VGQWATDEELFALARRELFTAVVGDVMDRMNLRRQFLPPAIKPLHDEMVVIGRAMPVLEADVFTDACADSANSLMAQPFGLMFRALDDLRPNEVYICTGCPGREVHPLLIWEARPPTSRWRVSSSGRESGGGT
jgi:hypothetical protein